MGRIAIIVIAVVGLYAVVTSMRGSEEDAVSSMPDTKTERPSKTDMGKEAMADDMKSDMKDDMANAMPKLSRDEETKQLLAELKSIPVREYAANKSRYERLLELHPGNETFSRKLFFYSEKLRNQQASY